MGRNQQQQQYIATMPAVFQEAYIAKKSYIKAKESTQESINKIMIADWNFYLKAMKAKVTQDKKEQEEHIQQVTQQNTTLFAMVQEQQKKIEQLMSTSKILIKYDRNTTNLDYNGTNLGDKPTKQ